MSRSDVTRRLPKFRNHAPSAWMKFQRRSRAIIGRRVASSSADRFYRGGRAHASHQRGPGLLPGRHDVGARGAPKRADGKRVPDAAVQRCSHVIRDQSVRVSQSHRRRRVDANMRRWRMRPVCAGAVVPLARELGRTAPELPAAIAPASRANAAALVKGPSCAVAGDCATQSVGLRKIRARLHR